MATNSISALQEHCVHNSLPIPTYNFEDLTIPSSPAKFACHCKMGHISAVATATSKKEAKHDVAKMVITKLRISENQKGVPVKAVTPSKPLPAALDNPIGKMNEYCSKNRYMYPTYYEMGVKNGEFVVQCKHQSFVTEGLANNKKTAKQLAAYNMLIMLNKAPAKTSPPPSATTHSNVYSNPPDVVDRPAKQYSDDEIIKLYNEIIRKRDSVHTKLEPAYTLTDPFSPSVDQPGTVEEEKEEETKTVEVSEEEVADLQKQFEALKQDYTMQVVSHQPMMMSLQMPDSTLMEMGNSANECKLKLFTLALGKYKND